jgi:hypothetical protein
MWFFLHKKQDQASLRQDWQVSLPSVHALHHFRPANKRMLTALWPRMLWHAATVNEQGAVETCF